MVVRVLFIGDIVGKPAREYLKDFLPVLRERENLDLIIANGENASGGSGIIPSNAKELFSSGIDIITSGDHIFKKREVKDVLENMDVLRPLNYGPAAWGKGYLVKEFSGFNVAVINLLGRVFMQPTDCPFKSVEEILPGLKDKAGIIIVDMHAEATSEKVAMGYFLAGRVSAVLGTHTHIPTADERIIDDFTAYVTDAGMTGSFDSVLGREKTHIIERFVTNMPLRFNLAKEDVRIQGVIFETESETGKSLNIRRVSYSKGEDK